MANWVKEIIVGKKIKKALKRVSESGGDGEILITREFFERDWDSLTTEEKAIYLVIDASIAGELIKRGYKARKDAPLGFYAKALLKNFPDVLHIPIKVTK